MAQAEFVQEGASIDYTPSQAVSAGDVIVQGDLVGVVKLDIAANKLGALAVTGVFEFAKGTGNGSAIAVGSNVYWDDASNLVTTTSLGNKLIGKCVKAAGDADSTARVRLSQ
jgi:predicted RecA/RadA family phage recombinase